MHKPPPCATVLAALAASRSSGSASAASALLQLTPLKRRAHSLDDDAEEDEDASEYGAEGRPRKLPLHDEGFNPAPLLPLMQRLAKRPVTTWIDAEVSRHLEPWFRGFRYCIEQQVKVFRPLLFMSDHSPHLYSPRPYIHESYLDCSHVQQIGHKVA